MKKALIAVALAALASNAYATIQNGAHDLAGGNPSNVTNYGTGAISTCLFCHTPHNADTLDPDAPIWNRTNPLATAFTGAVPGQGSLRCLSCHDGSGDMGDTLRNGTNLLTTGTIGNGASLGTDLANDHPVGVAYPAAGVANMLLARATAVTNLPGTTDAKLAVVECNGCHDPHLFGNTTRNDAATTASGFLRTSMAAICAACHNK